MKPINPPLPLFFAPCARCGASGHSLDMATGSEPFTYVCFACQSDGTREEVRLAANAFVATARKQNPSLVARARSALGLQRPRNVDSSDPSWAGCGVQP